jgi:hypothetical protein
MADCSSDPRHIASCVHGVLVLAHEGAAAVVYVGSAAVTPQQPVHHLALPAVPNAPQWQLCVVAIGNRENPVDSNDKCCCRMACRMRLLNAGTLPTWLGHNISPRLQPAATGKSPGRPQPALVASSSATCWMRAHNGLEAPSRPHTKIGQCIAALCVGFLLVHDQVQTRRRKVNSMTSIQ